jgi:hypothetical protein
MDVNLWRIMFDSKCYTEERSTVKRVLVKFEAGSQKGEVNTEVQATGGVQFRAKTRSIYRNT